MNSRSKRTRQGGVGGEYKRQTQYLVLQTVRQDTSEMEPTAGSLILLECLEPPDLPAIPDG